MEFPLTGGVKLLTESAAKLLADCVNCTAHEINGEFEKTGQSEA
jgi:hypothetical protein